MYLQVQRTLNFVGGSGYVNRHYRGRSDAASLNVKITWPNAMLFFYGDMSRTLSFHRPYHRIYMRREDESSLPSQKSIVTCCSGYGRKWISTWCLPRNKGRTYGARVRYAKETWRFSVSICRSHVTIIYAIQLYRLCEMRQGIKNNRILRKALGYAVTLQ